MTDKGCKDCARLTSPFLRGSTSARWACFSRRRCPRANVLGQLFAPGLAVPFFEGLIRDLPLHEQLCELSSLSLALEWHGLLSIYLPARSRSMLDSLRLCPSDDADMTVALEHRQQHVMYFGDIAVESQVLEDVMVAQAIAVRCCFVERSVSHDDVASALDQDHIPLLRSILRTRRSRRHYICYESAMSQGGR